MPNTIANTPATGSTSVVEELESFALFAVLIIGLGAFQKTHMIAVWLLGICALVVVLKVASGEY